MAELAAPTSFPEMMCPALARPPFFRTQKFLLRASSVRGINARRGTIVLKCAIRFTTRRSMRRRRAY